MGFPFFVLFLLLCIFIMYTVKRSQRLSKQQSVQFWNRESEADNVRKQDISHLNYIYIPIESLPFGIDSSPEVQKLETVLRQLDSTQILNLNGYTNTDLKLEYGVSNLNFLSECDDRFILLVRTLYQWACLLLEHDYVEAAIQVAEYSVEIGSDISGCYYMLTDYYRLMNDQKSFNHLKKTAETLTGINANLIKDYLNKSPI